MKTITEAQRKIMDKYEKNLIAMMSLPEKEHMRIMNADVKHGRPNPFQKYNIQNKRNFILDEIKRLQKWKSS